MKLHLLAFGKLKTPGLRQSADYYIKLLQPWVSLQELELKPVPVLDKSPSSRLLIQNQESKILRDRLEKIISPRGGYYLLDEGGKTLNTQGWAKQIKDWQNTGHSEIGFCIGSSMGFNEDLKDGARTVLSLGPQTLSHDLARVVLLEQLYRAWSVVRGHPYHNEG